MKVLCLFLGLLACCGLNAQQKFIEVSVTDTVLAKADFFIYRISLANAYDDVTFDVSSKTGNNKAEQLIKTRKNTFDSLVLDLRMKGFTVLPKTLTDSFRIMPGIPETLSASVLLHSIDSLSQLYQRIKKLKYLIGVLETGIAKDESVYQNRLYSKLMAGAKKKAQNIAEYSNKQLWGVLSVTEIPEEKTSGGWTSYPPLSALAESAVPGWHTTIQSGIGAIEPSSLDRYPIRGAFTVRFLIE